jgi:hypothetical protein
MLVAEGGSSSCGRGSAAAPGRPQKHTKQALSELDVRREERAELLRGHDQGDRLGFGRSRALERRPLQHLLKAEHGRRRQKLGVVLEAKTPLHQDLDVFRGSASLLDPRVCSVSHLAGDGGDAEELVHGGEAKQGDLPQPVHQAYRRDRGQELKLDGLDGLDGLDVRVKAHR